MYPTYSVCVCVCMCVYVCVCVVKQYQFLGAGLEGHRHSNSCKDIKMSKQLVCLSTVNMADESLDCLTF